MVQLLSIIIIALILFFLNNFIKYTIETRIIITEYFTEKYTLNNSAIIKNNVKINIKKKMIFFISLY